MCCSSLGSACRSCASAEVWSSQAFGWKLLNSDERPDGERDATKNPSPIPDPFYPLTMPLTVGPGSISVAITLGSQRPRGADWTQLTQYETASQFAGIIGDRAECLFLLPLRAAHGERPRQDRHERHRAAFGFHHALHRHPDLMERVERIGCSSLGASRRRSDRRSRHDPRATGSVTVTVVPCIQAALHA